MIHNFSRKEEVSNYIKTLEIFHHQLHSLKKKHFITSLYRNEKSLKIANILDITVDTKGVNGMISRPFLGKINGKTYH